MKLDTMLVGFVGEVSTVQNEQDSSIRNSYSILLAGLRTPNSAMISQRLDVQDLFHATVITTHHFVYFKAKTDVGHVLVKTKVRRNRDIEKTLRPWSIRSAMVSFARNFKPGLCGCRCSY